MANVSDCTSRIHADTKRARWMLDGNRERAAMSQRRVAAGSNIITAAWTLGVG
jgi:hypothetical protein